MILADETYFNGSDSSEGVSHCQVFESGFQTRVFMTPGLMLYFLSHHHYHRIYDLKIKFFYFVEMHLLGEPLRVTLVVK